MGYIEDRLASVVENLSDQNYEESLALYFLWFDIGLTYFQSTTDQIFDDVWKIWRKGLAAVSHKNGKFTHPTAQLAIRFARDGESNSVLAPHIAGLQTRLCRNSLHEFFRVNLGCGNQGYDDWIDPLIGRANLVAGWANLGCVEESAIHNHILQPLICEPLLKLRDYNADVIITLFKIAGATFEAYADPSVVDRCFELLKDHYSRDTVKGRLVQVCVAYTVEGGR